MERAVLGALLLLAASAAADNQVIGTIETTLNGEPQTFYLLQPTGGEPPTALWVAMGPDTGVVSLAAYESPDIELVQDPTTGATVPGAATPVLLVSFTFPVEATEQRQMLPVSPDEGPASIVYMEDWQDFAGQYTASDDPGEIHATAIRADVDGASSFTGTFHGTLRNTSNDTMAVEGRFETDGARLHR